MRKVTIALVPGDGAGPEMMEVACKVTQEAARMDGVEFIFEKTPMGWCALKDFGDTLPPESFKRAVEIGTIFFGGVGDPKFEQTLDAEQLKMKPEARCLLPLRNAMSLLLNFRPMIFLKELAHIVKVRPEMIPDEGITQVFVRFLLQDTYFGNQDLFDQIPREVREALGIKRSVNEVTGNEEIITDLGYYRRSTIVKYMRHAFAYAQDANLPLISVHKANVEPRYVLWKHVAREISLEFPGVRFSEQLIDTANAMTLTPALLDAVIACGNAHGDIITDVAAEVLGSMGLMQSSAINPDTGEAMFESGAGTAYTLAGQNKANPIGRIMSGAMMNRHLGYLTAASATEKAVRRILKEGWRTAELFKEGEDDPRMLLGTQAVGEKVLSYLVD